MARCCSTLGRLLNRFSRFDLPDEDDTLRSAEPLPSTDTETRFANGSRSRAAASALECRRTPGPGLTLTCQTRVLIFILHCPFLILHSGCATVATVHVVPLNLQKVNVNRPLLATFTADECYYWVNDESELCIAMSGKIRARLSPARFFGIVSGPGRHEFDLSLVLEGLPAGSSRAYLATFRTARSRMRDGGAHTRFASFEGVVSVWDYGGQKMGGRFRLKAVQQSFMVLLGWGRDTHVLCLGEFTAEHDRRRGEALFARTEEGALKRPPSRRYGIPIEGRRPEPESTDATQ